MSPKREGGVIALFKDIDPKGAKYVTSNELIKWFKPDRHSDVLSTLTTSDAIYDDFMDRLDLFGRLGVHHVLL